MKTMADTLRTLGAPITDECLVLNLLRGLRPRFDRVMPILTRMKPFPTFAETKDDLLLEELRLSATAIAAPTTALYSAPRGGGGGRGRGCKSGRGGWGHSPGGSQWPSFYNPWTGTIQMWPGPSAGTSAPRPAAPQ
jgi:hypothetical protein